MKNVIDYLANTVSRFPNKTAVIDNTESLTFDALWKNSKHISLAINKLIGGGNSVSVYLPKGCKMVSAFAGINMSGNFYVPLDTKSPAERVRSILGVTESKVLITDASHFEDVKRFYDGNILVFEDVCSNTTDQANINWNEVREYYSTSDPVYSIFTSGSTGTPKGVLISHKGVIDYIDWAIGQFGITDDAVIGNQAPFYFDNSTLDIYLMYATGATLNIIPETNFAFPAKLVDYLNDNKITFVFWVPFVLVNIANMNIFEHNKPKYLKDVFFAGEVMPNKHLNYWRKHLPDCRYVNLYGPTEITVDCTYYEVKRQFSDDESLPIGFPCRNSDVLILVDRKRKAEVGEQGELCVRGSSLAFGYYNNPEKTASAFIQNPLNNHYPETIYCTGDVVYKNELGEIMYVGRIDSQIKHNGYRIELGEIETAILGSRMVDNCCVCYDFTNKKIIMFYQAPADLNMAEFRKTISTKIPRYMLPSEYHREEILKQNGSGKIDRSYYNKQING